ncbi:hypothetical protein BV911_17525 [Pseudoruegeria sp. SK021]|nr:hypothetical protein BV911_17525 [Pseudoruegeria sp. SK021]
MNQLSLTPTLIAREPAFSFASRVAALNGVTAAGFATDMGLSFARITDGDTDDVAKLAALCGVDVLELQGWTPVHIGGRQHSFRGHSLHARAVKQTSLRGCPVCLCEDARTSPDAPELSMAIRGHWLFRPVTICLEHNHSLVQLWKETSKTGRYDVTAKMAEIAPEILARDYDQGRRVPSGFDRWIEARLLNARSDTWLDQFALYPAAHFCELLGRAAWAAKIPKWMKFKPEDAWMSFDVGFQYASQGEESIRTVLGELQAIIGEPTDGPKKKFGDLYERLAFDLPSDEYAPFRALLRDHIATTWPLGPGDDLMGEPVLERKVHSVRTAARELGMDSRRLRKLLVDAKLVRPRETGRDDQWELFDMASAQPYLDKIDTLVSAKDFQEALSISRSQFGLLRNDNYFPPSVDGGDHKPLWDVRASRKYLEGLLTGAEPIYVPMHKWGDIAKTAQRLKIPPGRILALLEARKIQRVGKHMTRDGYASILVTHDEIERLIDRPEAPGISIEIFARQCGLKASPAMRLVRNGHTPSTQARHPKTGALQRFLAPADIAAFHARFVTLRALAVELAMPWQTLRVRLADKSVLPFSPDGSDYGALYERDTINAAFGRR